MIELDISKDLGDFSLNLSLNLRKGLTVLFGPSGSGKSLTLQMIAGWIEPDSGMIRVSGVTYFDREKRVNLPLHLRRIGYVFQEPSLFPHMTIFENIAYGIPHRPPKERTERVYHMMERMRLRGLEKHYPHQISGGQKQRVALARALATGPVLLSLDEPFAFLDQPVRTKLRLDLLRILGEDRIPTLFVTHDVEEAFVLAEEIVVLNEGRVEQVGSKEDVFYHPQTHKVAKFFGAKNIFHGEIVEILSDKRKMKIWVEEKGFAATTSCREGMVVGDPVLFCIRPEEIMIVKEERTIKESLKDNVFSGEVVSIVEKGADHTLFFRLTGVCPASPALYQHGTRTAPHGGAEGAQYETIIPCRETPPVRAGSFARDEYDFEISIPNLAYRSLSPSVGKKVSVAFKWNSIWLIPEREKEK